jgi:hypothetical protein
VKINIGDDVYVSVQGVHNIIDIGLARVLSKTTEKILTEEGEFEEKEFLTVLPHARKFTIRVISDEIGVK